MAMIGAVALIAAWCWMLSRETEPAPLVIAWAAWGITLLIAIFATWATLTTLRQFRAQNSLLLKGGRDEEWKSPPPLAEFLLAIFARAKDIDGLMGDFEERFEHDLSSSMPRRRAVARYWGRVFRSIGPQMWQALRRLGLYGLIAAVLRR